MWKGGTGKRVQKKAWTGWTKPCVVSFCSEKVLASTSALEKSYVESTAEWEVQCLRQHGLHQVIRV